MTSKLVLAIFFKEIIIMSSEAQIRANQQNAQKSSGPTSVEGKRNPA